jgi:hypothetical protein
MTLTARGDLADGGVACKVETGRALGQAGLHPATGGSGLEACSGDMLLEALVACGGVTLKAVATAIDFKLRGGSVSAEGDLDFRGTLGVDRAAPVGFGNQAQLHARHRRARGSAPEPVEVDRALLCRAADLAGSAEVDGEP